MTVPGVFGKQNQDYLKKSFTGNGRKFGFMEKIFLACLILNPMNIK